jgi:hypothetical protein
VRGMQASTFVDQPSWFAPTDEGAVSAGIPPTTVPIRATESASTSPRDGGCPPTGPRFPRLAAGAVPAMGPGR